MKLARRAALVLLALVPLSVAAIEIAAAPQAAAPAKAHAGPVTADEALKMLMEGNERFVSGKPRSRAGDVARRAELAQSQSPYAVIVCCSDSRVGPELVFDSGLGDLFVIRTAGEVFADPGYGSIEYAVEHLHAPLVVVVGHERCGAVSAAVAGGEAPGHIASIVKALQPAVQATKGQPGDAIENAVKEQVRELVAKLQSTGPILSEFAHEGKLKIVGAYHDLDTGKVEMLPGEKKN
jgi:carbonic anhydrase